VLLGNYLVEASRKDLAEACLALDLSQNVLEAETLQPTVKDPLWGDNL
jgi:hypothetical protein